MFDKFRDECGVFGIYGHTEASKMAYLGLYSLHVCEIGYWGGTFC